MHNMNLIFGAASLTKGMLFSSAQCDIEDISIYT